MYRPQESLKFLTAVLMFALFAFAQTERVPNQRREAMSNVSTLLTRNLYEVWAFCCGDPMTGCQESTNSGM